MLDKQQIIQLLLKENALRFGQFVLKSGLTSPFFINIGEISSGRGLNLLATALAEAIHHQFPQTTVLYGPPYKGIALITAAALAYYQHFQHSLFTLYNRKEQKRHGEQGQYVGHFPQATDQILLIDDVMTTGGTKLEAINLLNKTFHSTVQGILVVVDRRPKSVLKQELSLPLSALITIEDLISYLQVHNPQQAEKVQQFYEA